jgi:hypothetical protein
MWIVRLDITISLEYTCDERARLTATSTVFSCPTKLISEVHELRVITAAMNTNPLLFVAFDAVMCAPSGDQLRRRRKVQIVHDAMIYIPQSSEESATWGVFKRFLHFGLQGPIGSSPDFDGPVV